MIQNAARELGVHLLMRGEANAPQFAVNTARTGGGIDDLERYLADLSALSRAALLKGNFGVSVRGATLRPHGTLLVRALLGPGERQELAENERKHRADTGDMFGTRFPAKAKFDEIIRRRLEEKCNKIAAARLKLGQRIGFDIFNEDESGRWRITFKRIVGQPHGRK